MSKGLNGKVVVITGASSGIGKAMAREYAAMGAKVVLGARQADKLEALTKEIVANSGKAAWCATDV
ncbi:MAG: SDR family NAD(P)-dependent oxidoreductase, partial [Alistipes sp.]|nr:SDR family NAD(P)-dependent oxidoreductase [Alistipes sp.]